MVAQTTTPFSVMNMSCACARTIGRQAGVIGDGAMAERDEMRGGFLRALARQRIDDAAFSLVRLHEVGELFVAVLLRLDCERNIRPVEAGDEDFGLTAEELANDVGARRLVRGRRERADGHAGKRIAQVQQHLVFRPERCAPLRDAMGFVDSEELHVEPLQRRYHAIGHQTFGREIEDADVSARDALPYLDVFIARGCGIYGLGRDARELQRGDLILHQRDERRNDNGQTAFHQCGHLIAQRFARTRRHDSEHMPVAEQAIDDALLARTERLEAEGLAQNLVLAGHFSQVRASQWEPASAAIRDRAIRAP